MNVVTTGTMITVEVGTEVSKVSIGKDTVIFGLLPPRQELTEVAGRIHFAEPMRE
jgi:hypothetical protein